MKKHFGKWFDCDFYHWWENLLSDSEIHFSNDVENESGEGWCINMWHFIGGKFEKIEGVAGSSCFHWDFFEKKFNSFFFGNVWKFSKIAVKI